MAIPFTKPPRILTIAAMRDTVDMARMNTTTQARGVGRPRRVPPLPTSQPNPGPRVSAAGQVVGEAGELEEVVEEVGEVEEGVDTFTPTTDTTEATDTGITATAATTVIVTPQESSRARLCLVFSSTTW